MYYVYILENKAGKHYIGIASNADRRLSSHNSGKVRSTRPYKPWEIIYAEECDNRIAARKREINLKTNYNEREKILNKLR